MPYTTNLSLLSASPTDAATDGFNIGDREFFSLVAALGGAVGSVDITVEVSNDCVNWVGYNRLTSNVTDSAILNDTRVATITVDTVTPNIVALIPDGDHFAYLRVSSVHTGALYTVTLSDDGSGYSAADEVTVSGGNADAVLVIDSVDGTGQVTAFHIKVGAEGTGYSPASGVSTSYGGAGTGFEVDIVAVTGGSLDVTLQAVSS